MRSPGTFRALDAWERGEVRLTLKHLEAFAKATHTPGGFLFLDEPPADRVPIPYFRTVANAHVGHPSPELLATIYLWRGVKYDDVYLKGYASLPGLVLGLTAYFAF